MNALVEVFLAALDLMKAEWRVLRCDAFRVGTVLVLIWAAGVMLIASSGFLLWAFYFFMEYMGANSIGGALGTGVMALGISWLFFWIAYKRSR